MGLWMLGQAAVLTSPVVAMAGAVAMAIPVAIHLLTRLRRRPVVWGAMRFLFEVQRRQRRRLRLEQMMLLAVRCLIPLVLGLALAGPVLSGFSESVGGWLGGVGSSGRLLCLVIDDSLSSQAIDGVRGPRFERLRGLALGLIDGLDPSDRVSLWRAGRPGGRIASAQGLDSASARRAIESIRPRYSRSDLISTLTLLKGDLSEDPRPHDRIFVVVLSDFSNGAVPIDQAPPRELVELGELARVLVVRPARSVTNVQVADLMPRRSMVVVSPSGVPASVPVDVRLRRFGPELISGLSRVELAVFGGDMSSPVAVVRRDHRWSVGQGEAVIHASIPLGTGHGELSEGDQRLIVRAKVDSGDTVDEGDAISSDNDRRAAVVWRDRLRVGVVDVGSGNGYLVAGDLTAERWLRLALSAGDGSVDFVPLEAGVFDAGGVDGLDAVMVLRPDLVSSTGWEALHSVAMRGGLVWLFAPAGESVGVWGGVLRERFGLSWRLGVEPQEAGSDEESNASLALDVPVPEALGVLGADWQALLGPVRVMKYLNLDIQGEGGLGGVVWLKTVGGDPLLLSGGVGEGRVLLMTAAIDPGWTNLPTKPLFVPLLHETLRGVLGMSGGGMGLVTVVSGDQPLLGERWSGAQRLALVAPTVGAPLSEVSLRVLDGGIEPVSELDWPGVYAAVPDDVGQALVVNVDADGGDTRCIEEQRLEQWLSAVDGWSWFDEQDGASVLAEHGDHAALGWPLLWVVLGVMIVEMFLARRFSYAAASGDGLWVWAVSYVRGIGNRSRVKT